MYEKYFGLTAKPFQLTPDPDFFFNSRGHNRARAFLQYGLLQKEGFIVITGEVGAGKTTLIQGLVRNIEQQGILAAQIVSTQVSADDLLKLVAAAFRLDLPVSDKAATLARLEAFFRGLHAEGRRALLVVDEAQNLSPRAVEELRMLSNFQVGTDALVQSFLVGQPEFRHIMQRPEMQQLKQRVIASYHLGPLDRPEVRQYIEHRLRHAGWTGNPHIHETVFDQVYDHTTGVPRRINTLFDRLLLDCYLAERSDIGPEDARAVIAEYSEEFGTPGSVGPVAAAGSEGGRLQPPEPGILEDFPATPATERRSALVVPLHEAESDRLPTRYDLLDMRIRKLEATQEMLQRIVGRMARALPPVRAAGDGLRDPDRDATGAE